MKPRLHKHASGHPGGSGVHTDRFLSRFSAFQPVGHPRAGVPDTHFRHPTLAPSCAPTKNGP